MLDLVAQDRVFPGEVMLRVAADQLLVVISFGVQPLALSTQAVLLGQDAGGAELAAGP